MTPEIYALVGAFLLSLLAVAYRAFGVAEEHAWTLGFLNSLAGGIVLLPILPPTSLEGVNALTTALLILSGLLWTFMMYWDIRAYGELDVALNALLNTIRIVLLAAVGALAFNEYFSGLDLFGTVLIISAILCGVSLQTIRYNPGAHFRLMSVGAGSAALIVDKYLSEVISFEVLLLSGYFIPALFYVMLKPSTLASTSQFVRTKPMAALFTSLLLAGVGFTLLYSMTFAGLGTAVILQQTSTFFVFVLGVVILGERSQMWSRGLAALLAVSGAALIVAS